MSPVRPRRGASAGTDVPARRGAALLDKACDVLATIGGSPAGLAPAELAVRLGLPRATLYRILATLVEHGLLRRHPSRRTYLIGFRILEMAQDTLSEPDLPAAAAPELRGLRDATGETAYVAVLEGRETVGISRSEGAHEVRSAARLGVRKPLHCTSQGKAMLAFLPETERDALLARLELAALTPNSITEPAALLATLHRIRARGFAFDDEEIARGVRCVGAPVLNPSGKVLGAVSIAGPARRMTLERLELLGPEVAAAGRRIGAAIRPLSVAPSGPRVLPLPVSRDGVAIAWSATPGRLWWADAGTPGMAVADTDGGHLASLAWATPIAALLPGPAGGCLVVDAAGTLALLSPEGQVLRRRALPHRPRAAAMAPDGTLWLALPATGGDGSLVAPLRPGGGVGPGWRLPGMVSALAWTDGGMLYAASTAGGTIHRVEASRPVPLLLTRLPAGAGRPCGLAVDAEGGIWTALRDGWSAVRITPEGEIDQALPLPVPRPVGLAFGGPGLATLYVTSTQAGLTLEALASAPLAGRIFALAPRFPGAMHAPDAGILHPTMWDF